VSTSTSDDDDGSGRLRVGQETPPCESPCPGCGAYYWNFHGPGCEYEECPICHGPLVACDHPLT
jgi:hypothetical protein